MPVFHKLTNSGTITPPKSKKEYCSLAAYPVRDILQMRESVVPCIGENAIIRF
jgi:hypothetical protein